MNYRDTQVGDTIELNVLPVDYDNHSGFMSCNTCLIATAAKRQFNETDVRERTSGIKIKGIDFSHKEFSYSYYKKVKSYRKPFSLTLTRMYV